jgi:ethylmalonyl-CoA mutase
LQQGADGGILTVDPAVEEGQKAAVKEWRSGRDEAAVEAALSKLGEAARDESVNIMPATIACSAAGATTGEWASVLREVFGEYRAPTGVADAAMAPDDDALSALRDRVEQVSESLGRRVKILVGKPGLDGHSNGAEQIAVRARDAGMDVVYEGIRLTPERIAQAAVQEGVHVVGLSILSGSHLELIPTVLAELREAGADVPVVVGGIIPDADAAKLREAGVDRIYTPKDFEISRIMGDIVDLVAERNGVAAAPAAA